jgi:hypothetical protein
MAVLEISLVAALTATTTFSAATVVAAAAPLSATDFPFLCSRWWREEPTIIFFFKTTSNAYKSRSTKPEAQLPKQITQLPKTHDHEAASESNYKASRSDALLVQTTVQHNNRAGGFNANGEGSRESEYQAALAVATRVGRRACLAGGAEAKRRATRPVEMIALKKEAAFSPVQSVGLGPDPTRPEAAD